MPALTVQQAIDIALQHHRAGNFAEAESIYRQVLAAYPNEENSLNLLGVIAHRRGQLDEAAGLIGRAIAINPEVADYHNNLALVWTAQGKHEEAAAECRRALQLKPDSPEIYNNLGNALRDQGQLEESVATFRKAIQLRPGYAGAHHNLGMALRRLKRTDEAVAICRHALELDGHSPEAYVNLGAALKEDGQTEAAMDAYRKALQINPDLAEAYNNIGDLFSMVGLIDEAIVALDRAIELNPDYRDARFNCSLALLVRGDYARAWPLYEARKGILNKKLNFSHPMWDGGPIEGRRLLIHAEQGLGDTIQFVRYAELAAARGAQVILECQESLFELLRGVKGVSEIVKAGDPLPPFDVHVPMLSQPLLFQTTRRTIPGRVPYLSADPKRRETWQGLIGSPAENRRRVGLAWAGNSEHSRNHVRSMSLEALLPLFSVEEIDFYNLQIGPEAEQIPKLPNPAAMINLTSHIKDFADTAALMMELDLIVSVDTAVAHLAGALGRPVWTLIPFVPDWRWGLAEIEGDKSPWYPTMQLFRQPRSW